MSSRIYFRIQPAGLGVAHDSESSAGAAPGLDVFEYALDTLRTDTHAEAYGDEVVVVGGGESWANGDVEGVRIDGAAARVLDRVAWAEWVRLLAAAAGLPTEYEDHTSIETRDLLDNLDDAKLDRDAIRVRLEGDEVIVEARA